MSRPQGDHICGNGLAPAVTNVAEAKGDPMCEFDAHTYDKYNYTVVCNVNNDESPGCGSSIGFGFESPEDAIEFWNKRADNEDKGAE